jgi:RNA polymerase sigma-70 factor, ECF subfamily
LTSAGTGASLEPGKDGGRVIATDEELAALAAARDDRAFAELVRRHQCAVRGLLARLTRDPARADDIAQDAFVKAHRKIASYSGRGSFKSWICRVAYTEFLMAARKGRSEARMKARWGAEADTEDRPSDMVGMGLDLDRALATLKDDERTCVVLAYSAGMSHPEVAEATGLPLGTVKSHVNRGRDRLKAWFEARENAA